MDDLIAFVTARLAEERAAAEHADPGPWAVADGADVAPLIIRSEVDGRTVAALYYRPGQSVHPVGMSAAHIARHDPARVLREIAAKRKRIASYIAAAAAVLHADQHIAGVASALAEAIKDDATAWNDHPGYKQEWQP